MGVGKIGKPLFPTNDRGLRVYVVRQIDIFIKLVIFSTLGQFNIVMKNFPFTHDLSIQPGDFP